MNQEDWVTLAGDDEADDDDDVPVIDRRMMEGQLAKFGLSWRMTTWSRIQNCRRRKT